MIELPAAAYPALVAAVWSACLAGAAVTAGLRARARDMALRRAAASLPSEPARALLVRPCAGADPDLQRALRSTGALARELAALAPALQLTIRFAVAHEEDPATPIARAVADELRAAGLDAALEHTRAPGPNYKIGQLAAVVDARVSDFDVIINADADVELAALAPAFAGLLRPLLSDDDEPRVGATWMPPSERLERRPETLGDRASAALLSGSLHAFPLLAGLDPDGLVGKLFAVRGAALDRVGDFAALARHLGEDMELAQRVRAAGYRVTSVAGVAPSLARGRSRGAVIARYARWLMVIRAQRPALLVSYPLVLAATPLILLLALSSLALGAPGPALAAAGFALAVRVAIALLAARVAGRPRRGPLRALLAAAVDAPLADALLWAAFFKALGPREVEWRGRTLRIGASGVLESSPRGSERA